MRQPRLRIIGVLPEEAAPAAPSNLIKRLLAIYRRFRS